MQQTFKQIRFLSLALLVTFSALLFTACNNEGEKKSESTTDSVVAPAPATTDSLPPIDTNTQTRPDGGSTTPTPPPTNN
jgi:hypothetical protein